MDVLLAHVHDRDSLDLSLHEHLQAASQRKTSCRVSLTEVNPFLEEYRQTGLLDLAGLLEPP